MLYRIQIPGCYAVTRNNFLTYTTFHSVFEMSLSVHAYVKMKMKVCKVEMGTHDNGNGFRVEMFVLNNTLMIKCSW